jgi:Flp pilus assembly protein TadG
MKIGCGLRRMAMLLVRGKKVRRRCKGEDGAALVEIAIALPLMLLMLTGAVSYSMAFYNWQQLQNAVSTAAQALAATAGVAANPCSQAVSQVEAALPGWTASNLTYTVVITNAAGTATTYGPNAGSLSCAAAGSGGTAATAEGAGQPQTLTVSYSYTWFWVFTWTPFGSSTPSSALTASESLMAD